ncbi:MAG: hypothetical protein ACYSUY_10695 [Planctomycetota bacterium]|jgi:hypothetical protein
MDGNQLVKELVKDLSRIKGLTVTNPGISTKKKVFQLSDKLNGFIYVKAIAGCKHNWGITIKTVKKIETHKRPWCVILIYESKQTGYVISHNEYHEKVGKDLWPVAQGDYKISERKSLVGTPSFLTVNELVGLLSVILS